MNLLKPASLQKLPKFADCINEGAVLLGRGMFSCVYDNLDGTVTKFTVDEAGYNWLADNAYGVSQLDDNNPYKVPVMADYEEVGEVYIYCQATPSKSGLYPVYAVRMAKCEPLKLKNISKDAAKQVRILRKTMNSAIYTFNEHLAKIAISEHAEEAFKLTQSEHYEELARTLWYMIGDYDVRPDALPNGNLMAYNGHPVVIDPVFNKDIRKLANRI